MRKAFVLLVASFVVMLVMSLMFTSVASTKVFCPHNIISDSEFTNANAMTQQEIQNFLESKESCLATYTVGGKSAAQIIYEACQSKTISPKVMLATIQKETSLLGSRKDKCNEARGVSPCSDWTWAEGAFGCGLSGCPSGNKGFDKQATCAANTFRDWYNAGKVCEEMQVTGGTVIPQNKATYSLYKYTPEISGNNLFYNVYTGWGWDPKGGHYTAGTPEDGCCEYCNGKCYDDKNDPKECKVCYGGTWHSGKVCCKTGPNKDKKCYTPRTPENGCCDHSVGSYSGEHDPEECVVCYDGKWYECCSDEDCQHLEGHYCNLTTHTCEEEVPEFPAGVTAVFGATLFIFLMMRRKYIEK